MTFYLIVAAALVIVFAYRINRLENKTNDLFRLHDCVDSFMKEQVPLTKKILNALNNTITDVEILKQQATKGIQVTATAYNATEAQCDDTPTITASNQKVRPGIIALSRDLEKSLGLKFGDIVMLDGEVIGLFEFQDRMNKRKKKSVDIFMEKYEDAKEFGVKKAILKVAFRINKA